MRAAVLSVALLVFSGSFSLCSTVQADEPADPQNVSRSFQSLEVFPPELELKTQFGHRRVLVTGITADNLRIDLTSQATLNADSPAFTVDADQYVSPIADGEGQLQITAGGLTAEIKVVVSDVSPVPVDFIRDINPLLTKSTCNQGTCHGSANGKNGFKLSLRGYDALYDYRALVDDISGRRFNRSQPAQSLMLLKPTQAVPHEGGFLFDEQSRTYRLLQQWIAEGCQFNSDSARVTSIELYPPTPELQRRHDEQQLLVLAHYSDGSIRDVTRDAAFESSDFEVATISSTGLIRAVQRGEAAALVRYEGNYAAAPVSILGDRSGFEWVAAAEYNDIDKHINAKLERMKILPSAEAGDEEFLRRISLDIAGIPPTVEQIHAFVSAPGDTRAKRAALVEQLLAGPGYVDFWTLKWSDLLLNHRAAVTERGVWAFRNWIRSQIAENTPYNQFAYELVTANGRTFQSPAANYFRIAREPKLVMENMTQVFLGTRFNCNQCHDHPFERWTQRQYYELAAYFAQVGRKSLPGGEEYIFTSNPVQVVNPTTNQPAEPQFPFMHDGVVADNASRRTQLAQWLTADQNPYFAKSIVNRYWSYFFGRGIIDPVDDIRASNPPSNPELLDALTVDFVANGYDLKHLIRQICNSAAYNRTVATNQWNEDDHLNFSHAMPRRLSAEQLYDSIILATGAPRNLPGVPAGFRAAQLPDPNVDIAFLDMFGRAPRESPCECERTSDVSLGQTLNMVNGDLISNSIAHPQGLIAKEIAAGKSAEELIRSVYLSTLQRTASETELARAGSYFAEAANPKEAAEDLMWALINSPEFLFNR
jgi:hypothetical protein